MPIDPFDKDPLRSFSGIHDLQRLSQTPMDIAAQSLASIAPPLSALDGLQASRHFDPATASALNDLQRLSQPPKDILAQTQVSTAPPFSALESLQASRQFDPATASALKMLQAKPPQSVLDSVASAKHWLQSVSPSLTERIKQLMPEGVGLLSKHRDMLGAVAHLETPKWQQDLAALSAAKPFVPPGLTTALSNMSGVYAGMVKSSIVDVLAGGAHRDATSAAMSLMGVALPTSGILGGLAKSALDAAIARPASLDSAIGLLERSAIKDVERFQSLAAQHKSIFDAAAKLASASIASPFQGTAWGGHFNDRLQEAIAGVTLARAAGIDPRDFLFDTPELQAAEILDEATHLDQNDPAAVLAWQTDAYRRVGEAFSKLLEEVRDLPPIAKVCLFVTIAMTILGFIGTIESALQGFERVGRWVSDTSNTEQHQAADDFARSRADLLAGAYAAVTIASALQQSCYVTKHDTPVRATPGRTGDLIGRLPAGTCILVLERDGRWLRFAYEKPGIDAPTEAWVRRDHLIATTE